MTKSDKELFAKSIKRTISKANVSINDNLFLIETSSEHYVIMPSQYIGLAKICFPLACCLKETFDCIYNEIQPVALKSLIDLQEKKGKCTDYADLIGKINTFSGDKKENVIFLIEDTDYNKGFANTKKDGLRGDLLGSFLLNVVPLTTASNGFFGTFVQGLTEEKDIYTSLLDNITFKNYKIDDDSDLNEADVILLFTRFMAEQKKLKSAQKYANDFKRWSKNLVENNVISKSIFTFLKVEEYEPLIEVIKGSDIYKAHHDHRKELNPTSGLEIDAELSNYLEFLTSDYLIKGLNKNQYQKRVLSDPIIMFGPPGTGKTFEMQNKYCAPYYDFPEDLFITTFHQSFSYEEFVEGIKPVLANDSTNVEYEIGPGIFYQACEQAALLAGYTSLDECISDEKENRIKQIEKAKEDKKIVLLCIDEINRANVSAVFGDLISLVESSKRLGAKYEMTAKLPYSKKDFGVPANLMIIGTMNTADRSIQLLDSALRRRFKFVELLPNYDVITNNEAKNILKAINNRIRALLDKDHQIGHSYFIGKNTNLEILEVIRENIIPLLEEYFYNETDKIRRVLNETDDLKDETSHSEDYFYVLDMDAKNAVVDTDDFNEERFFYKLNDNIKNISDDEKADKFIKHLVK